MVVDKQENYVHTNFRGIFKYVRFYKFIIASLNFHICIMQNWLYPLKVQTFYF